MQNKFSSYILGRPLTTVEECDWRWCGIYKITNKISGKSYVGQAVDIRKRLVAHVSASKRESHLPIYRAINKYGIDNFEVTILVIINTFGKTQDEIKKELNAQETFYIHLHNTYENGYNATPGGDSGRLGFKHSEETIEKLRKSHENYKPKRAYDVSRKTYGYDILNKVFVEGESITDISHKTLVDYRSIGQICNNKDYKSGGRFISGARYLFAFEKEDLLERIDWYYSEEYQKHKRTRRKRND